MNSKPPIESVAGMTGRELDAAVHEHVVVGGRARLESMPPPHYSTGFRHLEAMIAAVREKGWCVEIFFGADGSAYVTCSHDLAPSDITLHGTVEEVPKLVARAALLTTYTTESTS